jgi:UDP-glucose 4-epimerase
MTNQRSFLITGGAGFIGSHLADRLLSDGHAVTALDNFETGSEDNLTSAKTRKGFTLVAGSILDAPLVERLVEDHDVVVHLAAAVGVARIVHETLQSLITNVRGTEIVLEAAASHGRQVLLASTSEVYGKSNVFPLRENAGMVIGDLSINRWSYAVGKATDEMYAFAMHQQRGLNVTVARFFNTVGPRQSPAYGMVIPRLVRQAIAGDALTVHGTGQQSRCFGHVTDAVEAVVRLMNSDATVGNVYNIGSSEEITILALAELIRERAKSESAIELVPYDVAYPSGFEDIPRRVPAVEAIRAAVGWEHTRSLVEIVDETIDYFRSRG